MALFGKNKAQKSTPAAPPQAVNPAPPTMVAGAALPTTTTNGYGTNGAYGQSSGYDPNFKHRGAKGGVVVGLNIGNDTIKALELRSRGGELTVSAMGMVPTPSESITNGVVTNSSALARAIRELFAQSGIKTRQVVTSISGPNALVVRVIEVPKMTDAELKDNLAMDADRYIPFPAAEVVMDHQALRELPTDPDSPNMEVLLAAAQSEVVDSHVQVLEEAKLDPQAIDVEPLSAARALLPDVGSAGMDYYDVTALINIGATGTEISVLRGDILVFTRMIPNGGHRLTESLVDYLGLPWQDAERLKRQEGDALPPQTAAPATATYDPAYDNTGYSGFSTGAPATTEVSALDLTGAAPAAAMGAAAGALTTQSTPIDLTAPATPATSETSSEAAGDWDDFDLFETTDTTPGTAAPAPDATALDATSSAGTAGTSTGSQAADPFDMGFFDQGPGHKEPPEQHGQKDDDSTIIPGRPAIPSAFDFSFDDDDEESDRLLPATTSTPIDASGRTSATTTIADQGDEAAPIADFSGAHAAAGGETSGETPAATPTPAPAVFSLGADPLAADPMNTVGVAADAASGTADPTGPSAFNFDFGGEEDTGGTLDAGASVVTMTPAAGEAGAAVPAIAETTVAPTAVAPTAVAPTATTQPDATDDFDLDQLFGDTPTPAGTVAAGTAPAATPMATAETAMPGDQTLTGVNDAFAATPTTDFDVATFGVGLSDSLDITEGTDAQTLYSILQPVLDTLAAEVRRSLEYHTSRFPDAAVRQITLVGGGAKLKNIDKYFTQSVGIPTVIGDPLSHVNVRAPRLDPTYVQENSPVFAVALGLALRELS